MYACICVSRIRTAYIVHKHSEDENIFYYFNGLYLSHNTHSFQLQWCVLKGQTLSFGTSCKQNPSVSLWSICEDSMRELITGNSNKRKQANVVKVFVKENKQM